MDSAAQVTDSNRRPHIVGDDVYLPLDGVVTKTATSKETSHQYIVENIKFDIPRIHQVNGFMQVKGKENPIILIGGGPSLKRPEVLAELKEMASKYPTIACGSSHDWCIENGIIPTYATALDPDPITANYFSHPHPDTIYLVASQCHPDLFHKLNGYKLAMWHCASSEDTEVLSQLEPTSPLIGGGCTVGLRSISIAIMFGYGNLHFFGFDSCLDDSGEHHAYPNTDENEEKGLLGDNGKIHKVQLGLDGPDGKVYHCMGYQLAQMYHFQELYRTHMQYFTPTIHGGGLIAHVVEIIKEMIRRAAVQAT